MSVSKQRNMLRLKVHWTTEDKPIFRREIAVVLRDHAKLCLSGYGKEGMVKSFGEEREAMWSEETYLKVVQLCGWIFHNFDYIPAVNNRFDSYGLKGLAEKDLGYITNGTFILAMFMCGYYANEPIAFSPSFNVDTRSIRRLTRRQE